MTIVQLPGGYHDDAGRCHREVELCGLSGRDEERLCAHEGSPAERITAVLARCVRRIGGIERVDEEVARELTVGDRLFLLLKLREVTFVQTSPSSPRAPGPTVVRRSTSPSGSPTCQCGTGRVGGSTTWSCRLRPCPERRHARRGLSASGCRPGRIRRRARPCWTPTRPRPYGCCWIDV
jgi:hypothetical protein